MTDLRQAAQQALEALKSGMAFDKNAVVLQNLRTALEQLEQEPTQWRDMVVVTLVREGINKHRARELADHFAAPPEQEPLEHWNVVEGWVKIDEVRKHFETVNCGTIYKHGGEGRVPLYPAAQRPWVGLTASTILNLMPSSIPADHDGALMEFARATEAKLKERNT